MTIAEQTEQRPRQVPVVIGGTRGGPKRSTVLRRDDWRLQPAVQGLGLLAFVIYATWAAFRNGNYYAGNVAALGNNARDYLSPFYSPCLTAGCVTHGYVWGPIFGSWWQVSPALLILIFPLGFRLTCYYYRKTYYRSFWLSPPVCTVADAGSTEHKFRSGYSGETRFPLILQNVHRYFFYFAAIFAAILTWDAIAAFRSPQGLGIGVGTVIFIVNAVLIWAYTLGCHSCRHLCGGALRSFAKSKARYWFWRNISSELNAHHQLWAWTSLIWIALADFYVVLVASGTITDPFWHF